MVTAPLKRYGSYGLVALGVLLGLAALLLLARSVENSTQFSRWQPWILVLNICAVVFFAVVLARKIWQLARDYRNHVPGSRLTARTVLVFGSLVVAPLLVVYLFSLDFLNRGIDSWFRVEVKQGLGMRWCSHGLPWTCACASRGGAQRSSPGSSRIAPAASCWRRWMRSGGAPGRWR